jgi:hypothetical protein
MQSRCEEHCSVNKKHQKENNWHAQEIQINIYHVRHTDDFVLCAGQGKKICEESFPTKNEETGTRLGRFEQARV